MKHSVPIPSYRDIPPREYGGENARIGMAFQDHVTAQYCLDMLLGSNISEVWCETLDDITLVRQIDGGELFEFIQVKSNDLGKHWSPADLCFRESYTDKDKKVKKSIGTSILEKSLSNGIGKEECRFNMVTTCPVDKRLELLTLPLSSPKRDIKEDRFRILVEDIADRVSDYTLDNGRNYKFWLDRASWTVMHSEEHVKNTNLLKLESLLDTLGETLFLDQRKELYAQLVGKVFEAAKAKHDVDPRQKRITRHDALTWLQNFIFRARNPGLTSSGVNLVTKLNSGNLANYIDDAQSLRRTYLIKRRSSNFLSTLDKESLESDAEYTLSKLKIRLDIGEISAGPNFLLTCIHELESLCVDIDQQKSGVKSYIAGFMYDLADRCVFRFQKAGT